MAFEKPLPEWNAAGEKPEQEVIDDGWQPGDKPPAEWWNWWMNATYEAMKEMRAGIESASPSGMIVMWSGTHSNIPTGWNLCDGNNGTPNLQDRFILGASSESEIGDTGGSHEVTLTEDEMPSHNHSGGTSTDGSHKHQLEMSSANVGDGYNFIAEGDTEYSDEITTTSAYVESAGNHQHSLNINSTGGDQPHENRPAFYKLAFIMKA
ncbi:hypothetical protein D7Z54_14600 [Salibacterium salarium]|uniref:Microcystin-dependent protein n=1 Tax=Salibacterium salarium TaxID=284579 RepID=A0A428N2W0_9BACI|nr:hypothetical protein [Salibacterium salarium]RSL32676.1 hypothetical protein D7Z54_14600 [Salibacterium salarium]